ncbi:hypothetical protein [Kribbella pratensis]|uniref:Uncharacterized protein n=1 Tax=Kribbella pratensis TaxID=2512112 RepID=A0A4R8BWL2_9ACTN|nr:hypothetical protein [Kribbella pratensis]TDW66201.1 hypothetical protein EV653_6223 [Kribbella pratensis]
MSRKSQTGAAEATIPPLEITRKERWAIKWSAVRDRARYRAVPIGRHTGWTRTQHGVYFAHAVELRKPLEARQATLEKELATLQVLLDEPAITAPASSLRPQGTARERHDWALRRRAELSDRVAARAQTSAQQAAVARRAEVQAELDWLESEYETLRELCESAYLVRVEMYSRVRCARADRNRADIPPAPPFDGPVWQSRRPHLASVQTRSA